MVDEAVRRRLFAPRLQGRGQGPATLARHRANRGGDGDLRQALSLANKAGAVITGFAKVESAISEKPSLPLFMPRKRPKTGGESSQPRCENASARRYRLSGHHRFVERRIGFGIRPVTCDTCCPRRGRRERRLSHALASLPLYRGIEADQLPLEEAGEPDDIETRRNLSGMSDTKNPGDKTLHVSPKTLSLKRPVEQGMVRQSFSHGRSKAVVVETVKRRAVGPGKDEKPAPRRRLRPRGGSAAPPAAAARRRSARRRRPERPRSGVVLRTLSDQERDAAPTRWPMPAAARRKTVSARRKRRSRRADREAARAREREAAEARKREEDERRRQEDERKRRAEDEARRRLGEEPAPAAPPRRRPRRRPGPGRLAGPARRRTPAARRA